MNAKYHLIKRLIMEETTMGDVDGDDEAYVHEAFLANSEHGSSKNMSRDAPLLSTNKNNMQSVNIMPYNGGSHTSEPCSSTANGNGELWQVSGYRFQNSPACNLHPSPHCSQVVHIASSKQLSYNLMSRASSGHLVSQPLQTHKSKGFRVVKLAPDLPPVNLPPSVRVISQPAFKSYHSDLPASAFGDTAVKGHVPRVSPHTRGRSSILNPGENSQNNSDKALDTSQQQDASTCTSQLGAEENASEPDLQMHPLLFQAPENQLPSYFPININLHDAGSTIHHSFPRNPPQADSCLSKSQCSVRSDSFGNATEQPEKAPSDLQTIDFHPLLQRANKENVDFASRPSLYQVSGDIRASQGNTNKLSVQSDCMLRMPMLGDNQAATSTASLTHNDRENNLDSDIRMCSARHRGKTLDRETRSVLEHRMLGKDHRGNVTFPNCGIRVPEVSTPSNLSLQAVPPGNSGGCHSTVDLHDDSVPDIVMEQEELSDSEEEVEHVEFECEEIYDSEDDEMSSELPSGLQNEVEFECEEIDDSEDDEMSSELPSRLKNKEFPFFSSKEEEIQANQAFQSTRYLMNRSLSKSEKPKRGSAKTNRPFISPRDVVQALHGRSSKKRSLDSSNMHPLQTVQCKSASASRKPRKRSLMADPSK